MNQPRPLTIAFKALFQIDPTRPPRLEDDLGTLFQLREHLRGHSTKLSTWYLGGRTKEDALAYEAFDGAGPTRAFTSIIKEEVRQGGGNVSSRGTGIWNGEEHIDGASMFFCVALVGGPSIVQFKTRIQSFLTQEAVLATTLKMVELWKPLCVSVTPVFYDAVFKTRPGAGWMLYLPRKLSVQEVPEAHALVPVMETSATGAPHQTGTVIVSIGGPQPFSDQNLDHVKRAHDIEIRLAGQDLLPRYADFQRPPP